VQNREVSEITFLPVSNLILLLEEEEELLFVEIGMSLLISEHISLQLDDLLSASALLL
jgi:hypothetical protein